jgi:hypothetical protein
MTLWSAEARFRFSAIRSASGLAIASSSRFVVAQHAAPVFFALAVDFQPSTVD